MRVRLNMLNQKRNSLPETRELPLLKKKTLNDHVEVSISLKARNNQLPAKKLRTIRRNEMRSNSVAVQHRAEPLGQGIRYLH